MLYTGGPLAMVHTDALPSKGLVQSNPIGQHVLLTAVLCPHAAPGWTVLRQPGRLYWIPELIPVSKLAVSIFRKARRLLTIDAPTAGPEQKQEGPMNMIAQSVATCLQNDLQAQILRRRTRGLRPELSFGPPRF